MTRATGTAVLIASLVLAACGGDDSDNSPPPDHSGNFVGTWVGTLTMIGSGQTESTPNVYSQITRVGDNALNVADYCVDGAGPNAQVTSSTSFRTSRISCAPYAYGTCTAISIVFSEGGTGNLADGRLTLNVSGTATGCGAQPLEFTTTFIASKSSTSPQALTIEPGAVSAAVQAELARHF